MQHGAHTSLGDLQGSGVRRFWGRGISSIFKHLDLEHSTTAVRAEKRMGAHLTPPCCRFIQRPQGFGADFYFGYSRTILLPAGSLKKLRVHLRKRQSWGFTPPGDPQQLRGTPGAIRSHPRAGDHITLLAPGRKLFFIMLCLEVIFKTFLHCKETAFL